MVLKIIIYIVIDNESNVLITVAGSVKFNQILLQHHPHRAPSINRDITPTMPRAKFSDNNIKLSANRKYPDMLVELLDKNGKEQGYLGPDDKVEHFSGEVEAINVKRNPSGHDVRTQILEIAENVDFDAGMGVTLKTDGKHPTKLLLE